MLRRRIKVLSALAALVVTLGTSTAGASSNLSSTETVDAIWRQHHLAFDFHSFDVRYSCDGLQHKLRSILQAMGAHRDVQMNIQCSSGSLIASAQFMVSFKMPVAATEANVRAATTYTTEQQLVARLHSTQLPSANDLPRFSAELRSISLTRNRRVRLDSGDCDLLMGVREQLLPQLGMSVTESAFRCNGAGTRTRPVFRVAALVLIEPVADKTVAAEPVAVAPVALAGQPADVTVD
jgi:hypothetical protein